MEPFQKSFLQGAGILYRSPERSYLKEPFKELPKGTL